MADVYANSGVVQDQLRLDCQLLVHPGDEVGHLKGQGQSSFDGKPHDTWELKLFRERCVDVAKEMASEHARAFAVRNARLEKEHGSTSDGLHKDVPARSEHVHTPGEAPTSSFYMDR